MDAKVKAEWIQALRSGNYSQGPGRLVRRDEGSGKESYCCLGVLCEISPVVKKVYLANTSVAFESVENAWDLEGCSVPEAASHWSGLPGGTGGALPFTTRLGDVVSLPALNDFYGLNFDQIVDIIDNFF